MVEMTKLNNGLTVLAKNTKHGISAKTFANRTQAYEAKRSEELKDFICHVTYSRPFYVVIRTWDEVFNECCAEFKEQLTKLATDNNKSLCQVFLWWREYAEACSNGDQSAILWEFERWYETKLKA